ncbi:HMG domain-containing protein 4a isoform X1 [Cyprinus carpio]|uniref:HMG domain-containing protein 4a isoform X1 n=2 Tax=Cyprinus carpio TaxID=7962 RepID=A0A9Q9ZWX3_CYPCA|nr:HMG domain-containing protein 4a isoform X1 [Cyprinus carpio]XP_042576715.1 HMG domain-containing protein 4a isoform X1 [Cyprinus carpio]XP_042576716.1 HMG domain-containing protein 4a isoform X1 [Cyprinus carpio]XP_042576718.1 HMG domain-containing protein 4a isoform X1 [Cyprinus carpio]
MAFEEIKKKGMMDISGMEGEVGLVAGRSQREKRRSYKDLLREEEEIAAQVRKTSKKHRKDSDLFLLGGDSHKKKKKHLSEDYYHRADHHSSGQPPHKKKRKSSDRSPSLSSSSSSHPSHSTDTAMGLLEAITSPLATGSDPTPHLHKKPSYPPQASSHSSKDRKRDSSSKSSHSYSHSRPPGSSSSKKHSSSSKSLLFHGGAGKGEPLTLCEAEGLKMKLILSSKEKNEGVGMNEGFSFPVHSSSSSGVVGHHSSSSSKKGGIKKEKDKDKIVSKTPKKKQHSREPLPVVGKEVEVVGHYSGMGGDSSSSGGELEAGELVIDDSYTHLSKKKKKSKKSKKKKDKERDREKGSREKKHSKGGSGGKKSCPGDQPRSHSHSHSSSNHSSSGGMYAMAPPTSSHHHQSIELVGEKKKKKEEKDRDRHDKDKPKKKNTTAYQVFCKEYRVNINAEQPGLVFGELSKKLAEVWKQLPEKDKLVWRQKAQYLQHKQNKAEAMSVKRKTLTTPDSKSKGSSKAVSLGAGLAPQGRSSLSLSPARVPDVDPIDAAAHLQLLGESLSLIGHRLQETEGMVAVSGSLSVLLDSILCALGPLTCLTAQVPQLNGCPRNILSNTLDNIAYIMPGL